MLTPVLSKPTEKNPSLAPGENENVRRLPDFTKHDVIQFDADYKEPLEFLAARRAKIVRQLNPSQNARAVVELGDIHLAKKELRKAEDAYRDAIRKDPHLIEAYKKIIPLLAARRKFDAADNYYSRLVKLTNDHPNAVHEYLLFRLAFFSSEDGEVERIQKQAENLLKIVPHKAPLYNTLGIIFLVHKSNPDKAQQLFQRAHDEDPQNIDALNNMGICLQHKAQYKKAYEYYNKALKVNANFAPAYENIASNYVTQKKLSEALDILLESRKRNLQLGPIWDHNVGWLMLLTGKLEDAKAWYIKKIKEEPGNNLLFNNLGVCYENLGNAGKARKNYQKSAEIYLSIREHNPNHNDPRAFNAFYNLARILHTKDKNDASMRESVANHLLTLNPDDPAGLYNLASARITLKKYVAARQTLEKLISLEKKGMAAYLDLGFLLECIFHEYDTAIRVLEEAVSNGFRNELIVNNLAFAYIKKGDIRAAERALDFKGEHPNTTATRGLIEFHKGNFAAGNKLYKKAISELPEDQRDEAEQIWHYEQASYWKRSNDFAKAKDYLDKAKAFGKGSYIYDDILKLEKDMKKRKRLVGSETPVA